MAEPERTELERSTNRWMWAGLVLMTLMIVVFPVYRIYEPAERAEAQTVLESYLAEVGGESFETNCSSCHGPSGRGGIGPAIGSSDFLGFVDDNQITQLIAVGVPGTEMVAYSIDNGGPMTSQEINAIATYLRSLEEDAEPNPNWRTPLADEGLSGEELFAKACSRCHGTDRTGIEDVAPDIGPNSFTLDESDEWIADRIRNGKNEMPRFGGVLTDAQINMIIALLRGVPVSEIGVTTTTVPGETGTTVPDAGDQEILAQGKEIFEVTGGGNGCADCHGFDAKGTADGPNIIGSSKTAISNALGGGVPDMADFGLTSDQIEAVYQYLRTLG